MNFKAAGIFNRCITLEMENEYAFRMPESYKVLLDGKEVTTTDENVVTLGGLIPDTEYTIAVCCGGETTTQVLRTKAETYLISVKDTGAKGDGVTNDTTKLQAAISACPAGGTVYVPAGTYLTGPLFLKSEITLWLEKDAVLLGDPERNNYPILPGVIHDPEDFSKEYSLASWEGNPLSAFASLITGIGVSDVDIIGEGVLDGNAGASDWWVDVRKKRIAWRPRTLFLNHCTNVRIQGIRIQNSPSWTIHPYYCDHLKFLDIRIWNPENSPNTDGMDPESCSDVEIIGVKISVGDDCIALKSGKLYMGREHYKPSEHITIRNCMLERGHGSVTIGSEAAGGIRDIRVEKCIFSGTDRGLRIKTRRGRGDRNVLDDICFESLIMKDVHMPVTVNMFYFCDPDGHTDYVQNQESQEASEKTPRIKGLTVRNVQCDGVSASFVCVYALPEMPMERLTLENVKVNFLPEAERKSEVPIMMDHFPEMSGQSFYIRNLRELNVKNVTISGSADTAPTLMGVDVKNIEGLIYG